MRYGLAVACGVVVLGLGTAGCPSRPAMPAAPPDTQPERPAEKQAPAQQPAETQPASPEPSGKTAAWPAQCLIENAAPHPDKPLLAVACTDAEGEKGAVMVFDTATGALRTVAIREGYVGWSDTGLLQWHPDGRRIGTNIDTNGIGLVDGTQWVGQAFPDETRDHGVGYVWVRGGERVYADTGAFFRLDRAKWRFKFDPLPAPWLSVMAWNTRINAVVGTVPGGLAAYDPVRKRLLYNRAHPPGEKRRPRLSPDGHWAVRWDPAVHPAPDDLVFMNGDTGALVGTRKTTSPRVRRMVWGRNGALAVSSHVHHIGGDPTQRRVDLFHRGRLKRTLDLKDRRVESSFGVAEAEGIAWSPDTSGIALLLDGAEVAVHDAKSGKRLTSFVAPAAAIPPGLPDYYTKPRPYQRARPGGLMWTPGDRLVRIAPHFVSVWTRDGRKLSEFVVPE